MLKTLQIELTMDCRFSSNPLSMIPKYLRNFNEQPKQ